MKNYASYWQRLIAALIDASLLWLAPLIALLLLAISTNSPSYDIYSFFNALLWVVLFALLINGLIFFFLNPYLISKNGGSLGKLFVGLRIENEDGSNLTFKQALFREYIGKTASNVLLGLGYLWIFKSANKQAWHDMVSDTVVVSNRSILAGLLVFLALAAINCVLFVLVILNFTQSRAFSNDLDLFFPNNPTVNESSSSGLAR